MIRRHGLAFATLAFIVLAAGTELWIHTNLGIVTPFERPHFLVLCGRRYDQGGLLRDPQTTYTFYVHPTVFDVPFPMPDVSPIPGVADWGGCPLQVVLEGNGHQVVYGFIEGGP